MQSLVVLLVCSLASVQGQFSFSLLSDSCSASGCGGTHLAGLLYGYRTDGSDPAGYVCDDDFTLNDAVVACKSVYLTTGGTSVLDGSRVSFGTGYNQFNPTYTGISSGRFVANNVGCAGSEATLNACSFTTPVSNCNNGEMVHLTCPPRSAASRPQFSFNLIGDSCSASGCSVAFVGLLIGYRTDGSDPAGYVCDDDFTLNDAVVACKSVYLANTLAGGTSVLDESRVSFGTGYNQFNPAYTGISSGRFVASDVGCAGSEATLNACSFTTPVSNCNNGEMVAPPSAHTRAAPHLRACPPDLPTFAKVEL